MKAKEWAAQIENPPAPLDMAGVLRKFIEEIGTVASQRGGRLNAVEGAVREQRQKFAAVAKYTTKVAPSMFDSLLNEYGKEFKEHEDRYRKMREPKPAKKEEDNEQKSRPQARDRGPKKVSRNRIPKKAVA